LDQHVDQNQELAALGATNIVTGVFQGFPISTSASRTAVVEDMGAGSQVAGLTGALVLGVLLVLGIGLVEDLPVSALAAVVIVAVLGLFDVGGARRLYRWRRTEFALAVTAFAGVAALGVLWGVGIAIALALLNFIRRAWYPHDAVLGRVEHLKGYHDTGRHPDARLIPGLVLYRFDAPLFFANADLFGARVRALAAADGVAWLVIAAEPITDIDVTAGETVATLQADLAEAGVTLAFAELKDPVRDYLRRYGIEEAIGPQRFFPTIGVAVAAYVKETGTTWIDWEERP
jgi:MFS superfamily sulfate permease-like transporter